MLKNTDPSRGRHYFGKTECSANITKPINMTIFHIRGWMPCRSISLCIAQLICRQLCTLYVISQPKFIKPSIKSLNEHLYYRLKFSRKHRKSKLRTFSKSIYLCCMIWGYIILKCFLLWECNIFGWSSPPPVALKVKYLCKVRRVCPLKINGVVVSFRSLVTWKWKSEFHCSRSSWIIVTCSSRP